MSHIEFVGEHGAVGEHVGQFLVDMGVVERRNPGCPLIAFEQLCRFNGNGFGEILRGVELFPVAFSDEFSNGCDG